METIAFLDVSLRMFLLLWARVLGMALVAPVFSSGVILVRIRVMLAFLIALVIAPQITEYWQNASLVPAAGHYFVLLVKEFLLGATIGFFITMIISSFNLSAQFFSAQIGLSIAEVFDSATQQQSSLLGFFFQLVAVLIFILIGGLHLIIKVVSDSFTVLPVVSFFEFVNIEHLMNQMVKYFGFIFLVAIKISLPIVITSIILIVALGVIGRVIPQANILLVGLPIQLSLGFLFIVFSLPFMVKFFTGFLRQTLNDVLFIIVKLGANGVPT